MSQTSTFYDTVSSATAPNGANLVRMKDQISSVDQLFQRDQVEAWNRKTTVTQRVAINPVQLGGVMVANLTVSPGVSPDILEEMYLEFDLVNGNAGGGETINIAAYRAAIVNQIQYVYNDSFQPTVNPRDMIFRSQLCYDTEQMLARSAVEGIDFISRLPLSTTLNPNAGIRVSLPIGSACGLAKTCIFSALTNGTHVFQITLNSPAALFTPAGGANINLVTIQNPRLNLVGYVLEADLRRNVYDRIVATPLVSRWCRVFTGITGNPSNLSSGVPNSIQVGSVNRTIIGLLTYYEDSTTTPSANRVGVLIPNSTESIDLQVNGSTLQPGLAQFTTVAEIVSSIVRPTTSGIIGSLFSTSALTLQYPIYPFSDKLSLCLIQGLKFASQFIPQSFTLQTIGSVTTANALAFCIYFTINNVVQSGSSLSLIQL